MLQRRDFLKGTGLALPLWMAGRATWSADAPTQTGMLVHERVPHNAEPRLAELVESWITPTERFYVRSHAPVPQIDTDHYRLSIEGLVRQPLSISLGQLREEFQRHAAVATLTCAGNRRSEHSLVKTVSGVPWQAGAIGNAEWAGARLSDLLRQAGLRDGARHVWFDGLDRVQRTDGTIPFGASIPLEKALADSDRMPGALVAYEMNGQPLSPDHGFPARTVVPGFIGARSVKWLGRIVVSDRPSPNHYVASAYKLVTEDTADQWSAASPLETFALNSVTCLPTSGAEVTAGTVRVRGYALASGLPGRTVSRVEVTVDGGKTWLPARFRGPAQAFCWRLWTADMDVTPANSALIVRAIDSAGNVQPETVAWNLKGYMFNAWHRTPIRVRPA